MCFQPQTLTHQLNQMVIKNAHIYLTKSIALENPATSIKSVLCVLKKSTSDIKVLFKTLGSDESKDFDEKGYTFFNTDDSPDQTVRNSLSDDRFSRIFYTAGVTDDGIGDPLPEFSQFQIKIVMQGTDAQSTTNQRFTSYCIGDIR